MKTTSILYLLKTLWTHISLRKKLQFKLLLVLSFFTSLAEIFIIGAILPFISVLMDPNKIFNNEYFQPFFYMLKFNSPNEIILPITIVFIISIIISTIMRFLLLLLNTKLSFNLGIELSLNIYNKIIYQSYQFHTVKNSSDIINLVNGKVSEVIFYIIIPTIILITSGIMAIVISIMLLYFIPISAVAIMLAFVFLYILIIKSIKKKLSINSHIIANESTQMIKILQESLGGIRDIIIDGTQGNFIDKYKNTITVLRKAQSDNQIFSTSPKFILEGIGMLFIAFFAYSLSITPNEKISMIPLLVGIVLSIQKLLPLLQQMFQAWSLIQGSKVSLSDTIEYLNLEVKTNAILIQESEKTLIFEKEIKLKNVSFKYLQSNSNVLKNINLIISRGDCIGFIGSTGSGKSTLLDIIMGLLEATEGELLVDNQVISNSNLTLWQKNIAHVPQSIYLLDATIEENIAFGIEKDKIDKQLVKEAAQKAQIDEVIDKMELGYNTIVGERGIQLSGGQRQRLGLARALYKKAKVIILDEATSALDENTERNVIESFESLGKEVTLLMIAHRITTLKGCTKIIELSDGEITRTVKYEDIYKTEG
jgi:ATP-binding cassette subfamily B protein